MSPPVRTVNNRLNAPITQETKTNQGRSFMFSRPSLVLRLEESALLLLTVTVYRQLHFSGLLFAALFLAPDLFMLGYAGNPRVGAVVYNLGHARFVPLALLAVGYCGGRRVLMALALVWFAHIAFDRVFGYGLKYPTFFKDTHLQRLDGGLTNGQAAS